MRHINCVKDFNILVLLQFSRRKGVEDSRIRGFKCLLSNDLIIALGVLMQYLSS